MRNPLYLRIVACFLLLFASIDIPRAQAPVVVEEQIRVSLIERYPTLRTDTEVKRIDPLNPAHDRFFVSGWSDARVSKSGKGSRWSLFSEAVVDVPVVYPRDRTLRLHLTSFLKHDRLPAQRLKILWNDELLQDVTLEWGANTVELKVPATLQKAGSNRLMFLPSYWVSPAKLKIRSADSDLGIQCLGIELSEDGQVPQLSSNEPCWVEGVELVQMTNSAFSYYLVMPERAVLHMPGFVSTASDGENAAAVGGVRISLTEPGHAERLLFERSLTELTLNPDFLVEEDLSEWAGQMVGITVSFWVDDAENEAITMRWREPQITGAERKLSRHDGDALARRPNVLVVLFDTLRADHIGPYGAEHIQTPTLSRLADRGAVLTNSRANSPWTLPSATSMFTSMHPTTHGVISRVNTLSEEPPYLPEIMQGLGYRTFGYTRNGFTSHVYGHARGFDDYHALYEGEDARAYEALDTPDARAAWTWDTLVEPFLERDTDKPFFMYFHELDPHHPYEPHPPFDTMYTNGYHSALSTQNEVIALMKQGVIDLRPADFRYLDALYQGEISFMDRFLEQMLGRFDSKGLLEDTLVVFVSDHGEEFGDHGSLTHGHTLYEELLRVPMIFSLKGAISEGARIARPAELIDLPPTILDLVGANIPAAMQGESLLPWLQDPTLTAFRKPVFANVIRLKYRFDAIILGKWKLIRNTDDTENRSYELFHLGSDPSESINLWGERPIVGQCLQQMLEWHLILNQRRAVRPGVLDENDLDEEALEEFRALGYLN